MRDDLDKLIREEVPADLKAKVAMRVAPALARNQAREAGESSGWSWFFRPAVLGGALAASVAIAVVLSQKDKPEPGLVAGPIQFELEMLTNAELLDDLDVLENWDSLKKEPAGKWKKKKS